MWPCTAETAKFAFDFSRCSQKGLVAQATNKSHDVRTSNFTIFVIHPPAENAKKAEMKRSGTGMSQVHGSAYAPESQVNHVTALGRLGALPFDWDAGALRRASACVSRLEFVSAFCLG